MTLARKNQSDKHISVARLPLHCIVNVIVVAKYKISHGLTRREFQLGKITRESWFGKADPKSPASWEFYSHDSPFTKKNKLSEKNRQAVFLILQLFSLSPRPLLHPSHSLWAGTSGSGMRNVT